MTRRDTETRVINVGGKQVADISFVLQTIIDAAKEHGVKLDVFEGQVHYGNYIKRFRIELVE